MDPLLGHSIQSVIAKKDREYRQGRSKNISKQSNFALFSVWECMYRMIFLQHPLIYDITFKILIIKNFKNSETFILSIYHNYLTSQNISIYKITRKNITC